MSAARWLLELTIGGRVYRYATDPVEVTTSTGVVAYEPGLTDLSSSLDPTSRAITVLGAPAGGWAALDSLWPLDSGTAVLRWHRDGETLSEALTLIQGRLTSPRWGEVEEPLSATIQSATETAGGLAPEPAHKIDSTSWLSITIPDASQGAQYPLILGYPGRRATGTSTCTPAKIASNPTPPTGQMLIADGHVHATAVSLMRLGSVYTVSQCDVSHGTDLAGHPYSYIAESEIDPSLFDEGDEFWVGWAESGGGGVPRDDRSGALRGAGEIIRYLLRRYSSIPVDERRWREHAQWLDQYLIDAYLDEPTDVWDWIARALLPILPVRVRRGRDGLWLQPTRWDATERDAVDYLVAGREIDRVGGVQSRDEVYNAFALDYALVRGRYYSSRVLTAQSGVLRPGPAQPDARVIGDLLCRRSQERYGLQWAPPMQTGVVHSSATALRILRDQALQYATRHRTARYVGGLNLARLEPGAIVHLTDAAVSLSGVAMVDDIELSVDEVALDLVMLDGD
jgi:hypothetical protein